MPELHPNDFHACFYILISIIHIKKIQKNNLKIIKLAPPPTSARHPTAHSHTRAPDTVRQTPQKPPNYTWDAKHNKSTGLWYPNLSVQWRWGVRSPDPRGRDALFQRGLGYTCCRGTERKCKVGSRIGRRSIFGPGAACWLRVRNDGLGYRWLARGCYFCWWSWCWGWDR